MCFNAAHAFAPTTGIVLCNLVVITAKMPTQVQTSQKNDQDLSEEQRETRHGQTESEIWLVNWEPTWEAAKMIRSNPNYLKMAEEYETSTMSTFSTRNEPTNKKH